MTHQEDLIQQIRASFSELGSDVNERQRRQWAAGEAMRIGRGGIAAVSTALRISPNTIKKGIAEITTPAADAESAEPSRIRKAGGGRKPRRRNAHE